jgi:serine phosphatase RsbU (regulator of sigma subunit)
VTQVFEPLHEEQSTTVSGLLGWLTTAWETLPAQVGVTLGPRHVLVYQNAASRALFGAARLGVALSEAFSGDSEINLADLDAAFASGQPVLRARRPVGLRDLLGGEVHVRSVVAPFGPSGGPTVGLVISAVDLTSEVRAELASNRAAVLARLSERINAASDAPAALQALTDTLVPELADVAAVYVLPEVRDAEDLRTRHSGSPDAITISPALAGFGAPPVARATRGPATAWDGVFAAGHPVIVPFADLDPVQVVPDEVSRRWLMAVQTRNLAAVPLAIAGRVVGGLLLIAAGDRQPYSEKILPFLTDVVSHAGVAVAQIRQHRRQAEASHQLQQMLLPAAPPPVPGLRIAARYVAGAEDVEVGGDWWDVVCLDDTHIAIGVGDVSGRGLDAAVVMGQVRLAMRTASLAGLPPHQVMNLLDRQVAEVVADSQQRGVDGPQFATALHGVLNLDTDHMVLANAGHLPLILTRPGGTCDIITIPSGPPLGLGLGGYANTSLHIPRGSSLLLFTDGLVEDRSRDLSVGLTRLQTQMGIHSTDDVDTCLEQILTCVGIANGTAPSAVDDIAVILIHREG